MWKMPRSVLVLLLLVFIGQIVYYYPQLPEKVASHFNGYGQPDNWSSKQTFVLIMVVVATFATAFPFLITALIRSMPESLINLPNKNYWLAAERREKTLQTLGAQFELFSLVILALLIAINQLAIQANLTQQPLSMNVWYILGAFLLFVIVWMIRFIRSLSIPK
jgi:uncharacterized membrane protein